MKTNEKFFNFINNTPNAFFCIKNIKDELLQHGFEELDEYESWKDLSPKGKYFVSRNDSSLIAFTMTGNYENVGFNIVATHSDSPSFSIKPNSEIYENKYLKLNTDKYGMMINYSWLDRPLSIAGRVMTKEYKSSYKKNLINIDHNLLVIPSQAIHINREVNDKNVLNPQVDMLPIISLSQDDSIDQLLATYLKQHDIEFEKICDYDLYLYNRDNAQYTGMNNEFILAPRLDDLACVYPAFNSLINSKNNHNFNVFCAFNNEEIGSLTEQGADSEFLMDILTRITNATNVDLLPALRNSFVISADNAHALHPNAPSKSDPTNKVYLNKGIVIKNNTNYTTNAVTSTLFKEICEETGVPYQHFACKTDMRCGATLGILNQRHVSVNSIDIGLPQLAMHSATETIGSQDLWYLYNALTEFYNTSFIRKSDKILIKK